MNQEGWVVAFRLTSPYFQIAQLYNQECLLNFQKLPVSGNPDQDFLRLGVVVMILRVIVPFQCIPFKLWLTLLKLQELKLHS
jgi:hypothetical protein